MYNLYYDEGFGIECVMTEAEANRGNEKDPGCFRRIHPDKTFSTVKEGEVFLDDFYSDAPDAAEQEWMMTPAYAELMKSMGR